jgi:DNA-binding XRE family transcriptional regulator
MIFLTSNIKYLRSKLGLNQADFGELFGCSRDNIASYERGTEPKLETLFSIVNYFHISIEDIYSTDLSLSKKTVGKVSVQKEKNADLNADLNANLSSENLSSKEEDSFKHPVNEPPPECEKCLEKDKTIEALQQTVRTQADYIDLLKEKIDMLTGNQNGGQKRKAG